MRRAARVSTLRRSSCFQAIIRRRSMLGLIPSASHTVSKLNAWRHLALAVIHRSASMNSRRLRVFRDSDALLIDVDRVGQQREHQALFAGQAMAAGDVVVLAGKNLVEADEAFDRVIGSQLEAFRHLQNPRGVSVLGSPSAMLPTELSSTAMRRSPCALLTVERNHWFPVAIFFASVGRLRSGVRPVIWRYGLGGRVDYSRGGGGAVLDAENLTLTPSRAGRGTRYRGKNGAVRWRVDGLVRSAMGPGGGVGWRLRPAGRGRLRRALRQSAKDRRRRGLP